MKKSLILSLASLLTAGLALGGVALQGKQAQALGATASSDAYGETPFGNANFLLNGAWSQNGSLTLDGNSAHPWKYSHAKNYLNSLYLGCESDEADSKAQNIANYESDSSTDSYVVSMQKIYAAVKAYAVSIGESVSSWYVQTLWMDYDISSFSDINILISRYLVPDSWLANLLLYSTDGGTSYSFAKKAYVKQSAAQGTNELNPYKIAATSADVTYTSQIRFAYASIAYTVGGEGFGISGISINAKNDFENKMNAGSLCGLSTYKKEFLAAEYAEMSSADRTALTTETCADDSSATYQARYTYLLNAWAKGSSAATLTVIGNPDATAIWTISVISVLGIATWASFVLIHSRKKHLER